ncbi:SCO6880 family protein [Glutamicibacter arilaitensis]|uniref:SCO6880 family protein n=1 Tax=Glutamicibacter arilaitensis TaxID=256701 RepID=UPI003FD10B8C
MTTETAPTDSIASYDNASFGRRPRTGVFMGLGWLQVILTILTLLIAVGSFLSRGFPDGIISTSMILIVGAVLILPTYFGRSLPSWIGVFFMFRIRKAIGQTSYRRKLDQQVTAVASPGQDDEEQSGFELPKGHTLIDGVHRDKKGRLVLGKPSQLHLPGIDDQVELYTAPGGFAFAYDKARHLGIIVAKLTTTRAFSMESSDRKMARTAAFDDALTAFGMIEGLGLIQLSDQTRMLSSRNILEHYDKRIEKAPTIVEYGEEIRLAGAQIDPFLDSAYRDQVESSSTQSIHEGWMTLGFNAKELGPEIEESGKGVPGFVEAVLQRLDSVKETLQQSGVLIQYWHEPRSFAALIRSAFDPMSTIAVSERKGDFAGVEPNVAGPMAVETHWDHLRTDSAFHRVYWISEWPRKKARMGFMEKLIFAGDFPHTVSQVLRPVTPTKALKKVETRKTDWDTTDRFRQKSGRAASRAHEAEFEDIESFEEQLVDGHGSYYVTGLVCVSGATKSELERNCAKMRDAASRARIELSPAYGQQDAAFSAAALPLAKGINLGVALPW